MLIEMAKVVAVVAVSALVYLGERLIEAAISEVVSEGIKALLERRRPKQKANKLLGFNISVNGVVITMLPEGHNGDMATHLHVARQAYKLASPTPRIPVHL